MTFEQIVAEVATTANISSDEGLTRIGRNVNLKHRAITSSLGLETTRQGVITGSTVNGSPYLTFGNETIGVTLVNTVFHPTTGKPLNLVNLAELRMQTPLTWPPTAFALFRTNSFSVEILFDALATGVVTVTGDGLIRTTTLVADDEPAFSEDYHDILIAGVLAIEYKILKDKQAEKSEKDTYDIRLAELKHHYAVNSWQDIHQGRTGMSGRRFLV